MKSLTSQCATLIEQVQTPSATPEEIAPRYGHLIDRWMEEKGEGQHFAPLNDAIRQRWDEDTLKKIKRLAWGLPVTD